MAAADDALPEPAKNPPPEQADSFASAERKHLDLSGRLVGEFQLLRKLGRGGMAEVYLADQTTLNRNVAVKVLRPEFTTDAVYLKRFQQEASAAGTLNHPNIVQVYLVGEQDGIQYIAQEYVQGWNLKEIISRKGPLELPMAIVILRQVAAALQAAAAKGIVHRDIKPENILLTRKGEAKVADFGLAQLTQHGEKVALTQVGMTMGTPLYMSPEQINGKPLDARSDLYSFGVMAYHMLAGKPPFNGETPLSIAVQHLNSDRPSLKLVRPDLPDSVCAFVQKLMAKNREDRYADPQAVIQELKQLGRTAAGKPAPESPKRARKTRPRAIPLGQQTFFDWSWTRQLLWVIPFCVLIAGSAAGVGWAMRTKDPFETSPKAGTGINRQSSPQAQYYLAKQTPGDPAGWQAILDYFDDDLDAKLEVSQAELHLAMIALQNSSLDEAAQRFEKMLLEGQAGDNWKKAHALAGLAVIDSLQGRRDDSQKKLTEVKKMDYKLDVGMKDALEETQERNRRK